MDFLLIPKSILKTASAILILLILGSVVFFFIQFSRQREQRRQEALNAKAPELSITLIEGWNVNETATYLENKSLINSKDFLQAEKTFSRQNYPTLANLPKNADLEGFLFPDTYRILKSTADLGKTNPKMASDEIIAKILNNTQAKLGSLNFSNAPQKLSVYQIITLASILEKETGRSAFTAAEKQQLQQERQTIAGIFYNRLAAGMPLESDATINYITGKNTPSAAGADLTIDSPYNTYKYKGLPKGPICSPSLSSIEAALNPIKTDYFFFLHKQPSGEVVYAKTFPEQVQNKQKYLK